MPHQEDSATSCAGEVADEVCGCVSEVCEMLRIRMMGGEALFVAVGERAEKKVNDRISYRISELLQPHVEQSRAVGSVKPHQAHFVKPAI